MSGRQIGNLLLLFNYLQDTFSSFAD